MPAVVGAAGGVAMSVGHHTLKQPTQSRTPSSSGGRGSAGLEIGGDRVGSINAGAADAQLLSVLRSRGHLARGDRAPMPRGGGGGGGVMRELCASPVVDISGENIVSLREIDRCQEVRVRAARAASASERMRVRYLDLRGVRGRSSSRMTTRSRALVTASTSGCLRARDLSSWTWRATSLRCDVALPRPTLVTPHSRYRHCRP